MKIKSLTSLGIQRTYSPEMAAPYHNYVLSSGAIHKNSHAVAYCLWAYRCLWLKAHYPEEWWASVLGLCGQKALERYMNAARSEGIIFGEIDISRMTMKPVAHSGVNALDGRKYVAIGLTSLKSVGKNAVKFVQGGGRKYSSIDEFIEHKGDAKTVLERLIKLGAFKKLHTNTRAVWKWYLHKYGKGAVSQDEFELADEKAKGEIAENVKKQKARAKKSKAKYNVPLTILRNLHRRLLLGQDGWTDEKIVEERKRQIEEFKRVYPKRKNIPVKIQKWQPPSNDTSERVMALYEEDYDLKQLLEAEKTYLGYYWHSPCELYCMRPGNNIENAKINGILDCAIVDAFECLTRNKSRMMRLTVTDGIKQALILIWQQDLERQNRKYLKKDEGVTLKVNYDEDRNSFTLQRGCVIQGLWTKKSADDYGIGEMV